MSNIIAAKITCVVKEIIHVQNDVQIYQEGESADF